MVQIPTPGTDLTDRERQVLELLRRGLTDDEIAAELSVSPATIKSELTRIRQRTGVHRRVSLAIYADRAAAITRAQQAAAHVADARRYLTNGRPAAAGERLDLALMLLAPSPINAAPDAAS